MIRAHFPCPQCTATTDVADLARAASASCACGWSKSLPGDAVVDEQLRRCPFCGTLDMYIQKDFPERIGVVLVTVGALLSTYFWWQRSWLGAIGTLVLFFLADLVLFRTRGDVTVCYRCLAQFRGVRPNPAHQPFDLAVGERYRQERLRKDELHRGRTPSGA